MAGGELTDRAPGGAPAGARGPGPGAPALALGLVFLLALFVRLAYLLEIRGTPLTQLLALDAETYDRFARRILAGTFRGEDVYAMNALYPYVVAAVYRLAHGATFAVFALQAVVDAASCALAAWLGARLLGPRVGLVGGALAALTAPLVFYCGALLTPTWIVFLCLLGTAGLARAGEDGRARWPLAAGFALGLATLARGNNLLFLPLGFACLAVARGGARAAVRPWLGFAAAFVLPLAVITARNFAVEGRWVPVAANYAAFYVGHNPAANGLFVAPPWIQSGEFQAEVYGVRDAVARQVGHPVTLAESARWLFGEGLRWAWAHPAAEARLLGAKLLYALNRIESPTNLNLAFAAQWSPLLRALAAGSFLLLPLAGVGLVSTRRRARALVPLYLALLVPLLTCLLVFVASEYRVAAAPLLAVFAAAGLAALAEPLRARGRPAAGPRLAMHALVLAAALGVVLARPRTLVHQASVAGDEVNFGTLYARQGQWVAARVLYERATVVDPANGYAWRGLAAALAQLDDPEGAARARARARALGALAP